MTLLFSEDKASDNANTKLKKWVRVSEFKNDAAKTGSPTHVGTEHVAVVVQGDITKEAFQCHE
jgi:hypothetical protein